MPSSKVAQDTLQIVSEGTYTAPSGTIVSIRDAVRHAVEGTRLYRPGESPPLVQQAPLLSSDPVIEVTSETTAQAARRLYSTEGVRHLLALNFASAKNPGGGFLGGAKAQEEDLARCSALYSCQITQPEYYEANRACSSMHYTDHLIYSPDVPFFRDDSLSLLQEPFLVSVITSPAPNAGQALRRDPHATASVRKTLQRRALQILRVAAGHGHRVLILGAWGCGVFRNDPVVVADVFAQALSGSHVTRRFERIIFAVYDRTPNQVNRTPFEERFAIAGVE